MTPIILQLALRNLARQPRRTILTGSVIVIGLWALAFVASLADGIKTNTAKLMINTTEAHVHYFPAARLEDDPANIDHILPEGFQYFERLSPPGAVSASQIHFQAQIYAGADKMWAPVYAIDLEQNRKVFPDVNVSLPPSGGAGTPSAPADLSALAPAWMGKDLARLFNLRPGDTVTLVSRTQAGAMAALDFTLAATLESGNPALDKVAVIIRIGEGRVLTGITQGYTDAYLRFPSAAAAEKWFAAAHAPPGVAMQSFRTEVDRMLSLINVDLTAMTIIVIVLFMIAMTGVMNTTLISVHERKRELGVLAALGLSRRETLQLICAEGLCLGGAAGLVGLALGIATVTYLHGHGINFSETYKDVPVTLPSLSILYPTVQWSAVTVALLGTVAFSALAAFWPAWGAVKLEPAEALRSDT